MKTYKFHDGRQGTAITVHVTPRAKRSEIRGILDDGSIRIRVHAQAEEGKANDELLSYLGKILDIPKSRIEIVAGLYSRKKIIVIYELNPQDFQEIISRVVNNKD